MPAIDRYEPGTFCWPELATSDPAAALRYYKPLFGWTTNDVPMGEAPPYSLVQKDGRDIGGMYELQAQQRQAGVPPNWASYVSVDNVDEMTEKARQLGATVAAGPFDVGENGRAAYLLDPVGAPVALWQAKNNPGSGLVGEPGTACWYELQSPDGEKARQFYTALFGWTAKVSPEYTEWHQGEAARGGMRETKETPAHWLVYFAVTDPDATVRQSESLGGKTIVPAMDIPKVGRFAVLQDPQGAYFALFKPA